MIRYELIAQLIGSAHPVNVLIDLWQLNLEEAAMLRAHRQLRKVPA